LNLIWPARIMWSKSLDHFLLPYLVSPRSSRNCCHRFSVVDYYRRLSTLYLPIINSTFAFQSILPLKFSKLESPFTICISLSNYRSYSTDCRNLTSNLRCISKYAIDNVEILIVSITARHLCHHLIRTHIKWSVTYKSCSPHIFEKIFAKQICRLPLAEILALNLNTNRLVLIGLSS
jgi:hypothetical protein